MCRAGGIDLGVKYFPLLVQRSCHRAADRLKTTASPLQSHTSRAEQLVAVDVDRVVTQPVMDLARGTFLENPSVGRLGLADKPQSLAPEA